MLGNQLPGNIHSESGMSVLASPRFIAPVEFVENVVHILLTEALSRIANFKKSSVLLHLHRQMNPASIRGVLQAVRHDIVENAF
ncbi:hypothetical protein D1872_257050 [compost metagenome]